MKSVSIILAILIALSCKKDNEPLIDYCELGISEFKSNLIYEGTISFCNAQPPDMAFIPGKATVSFFDTDSMLIHLSSDSISFDTSFKYKINCAVAEKVYPVIYLVGETDIDDGYYSDLNRSIWFKFGYSNCLNNTAFDGICKP